MNGKRVGIDEENFGRAVAKMEELGLPFVIDASCLDDDDIAGITDDPTLAASISRIRDAAERHKKGWAIGKKGWAIGAALMKPIETARVHPPLAGQFIPLKPKRKTTTFSAFKFIMYI